MTVVLMDICTKVSLRTGYVLQEYSVWNPTGDLYRHLISIFELIFLK